MSVPAKPSAERRASPSEIVAVSDPNAPPAMEGGDLPVLILAPLRNDARLTSDFLRAAGLSTVVCVDARELCARASAGCGALLLAEEALDNEAIALLGGLLARQPQWSDLPIAIITSGGDASPEQRRRLAALSAKGNVALIERPFRPGTLVSTLDVALRSRRRQFQVRDLLEQTSRDAEVLRASEERYRLLGEESARQARIHETTLSSTVDILYVFDLEGRFIYGNRQLLTILGKSMDELFGKTFEELEYPPDVAAKLARQVQEVIGTRKPVRDETPYTGTNGSRSYEYIFTPVFAADGRVEAVAGVTRDITERQEAEHALRASERQLQSAITATKLGLWTVDPATGVARLSPSSQAMHGMPGETLATREAWAACLHPEDLEGTMATFARSIDPAVRGECFRQYRVMRPDGSVRWIECVWQAEFSGDGPDARCVYAAGTQLDVTERVEAQRALEAQAAALRDADQRKNEFLAMLAHELRNPLSSVSNAVAVLKEIDDTENQAWAADVIERQTRQLARLVDDLLDVSRITRGKIELRRELLDAARCLESACEAVAPLIAEHRHTLLATVPRGELWLEADPTRLEQIAVNLLANAARYTEGRGQIWLEARRENQQIVIEVRDSGIGIAPEKIPAMFELFAQGERSAARSEGGLGIGLTLVRGLCELHGGSITACSPGRGAGSTFTVRLPAAKAPGAAHRTNGHLSAPAADAGGRVLVVDDNLDTAAGLARLLARRGFAVQQAHDGHAALQAARTFSPTAVLLDIGLPGMDGYEVARQLRADPRSATALVIAVSGYGQEDDRRRSSDAGFDHHLVKPVDFEELRALLASDTRRSQAGAADSHIT